MPIYAPVQSIPCYTNNLCATRAPIPNIKLFRCQLPDSLGAAATELLVAISFTATAFPPSFNTAGAAVIVEAALAAAGVGALPPPATAVTSNPC